MYPQYHQMMLDDYDFPFGKLDPENERVQLAALVSWDVGEEEYTKQFVNNGHPAHPVRIALGVLIIKQKLKCSDEWTVRHISENPYLQFFLGMKLYASKYPFGASTLWLSRIRMNPYIIQVIQIGVITYCLIQNNMLTKHSYGTMFIFNISLNSISSRLIEVHSQYVVQIRPDTVFISKMISLSKNHAGCCFISAVAIGCSTVGVLIYQIIEKDRFCLKGLFAERE